MKISCTSDRRGIALIIVLIAIFVLSILAGGFAYSMKVETKLARNRNSETELEWLGRSGVEYARWILAQQLQVPNEPYDGLNQVWAGGPGGAGTTNSALLDVQREVHLGNGSFTWKIIDLDRKLNINVATEVVLQHALVVVGVDPSASTPIVNSILDWIDPDDLPHIEGTESPYYQTLTPPYFAKNGPMDDISELLLVRGVTPEIYWGATSTNHPQGLYQQRFGHLGQSAQGPANPVGLVDLFTPISSGRLNLNTASAAVLQVIPGIDPMTAEAIVAAREGEDDGNGQTGPFRSTAPQYLWSRVPGMNLEVARQVQQLCDVRSRTFEVQVDAEVGGYRRQFIAVVGRNNPRDVPVLSFYWK
jgi:type II secretory pathway component PulK